MNPPLLWFVLAAAAYTLNVAFGGSVRLRLFSSAAFHWMHHLLYVLTFVLTAVAVSSPWWSGSGAGWWLLPAVVPLAVLPYAGSARRNLGGHVLVALSALPFYVFSLIVVLTEE